MSSIQPICIITTSSIEPSTIRDVFGFISTIFADTPTDTRCAAYGVATTSLAISTAKSAVTEEYVSTFFTSIKFAWLLITDW